MIDNNKISWVCTPCGMTANYLTCLERFSKPPLKAAFDVSTYHNGTCQVCLHQQVPITEARDFFYPDFTLIDEVKAYLKGVNQLTEK